LKAADVKPHNLRDDISKEGTITAIDVILSFEDQAETSCKLQYYESIGTTGWLKATG